MKISLKEILHVVCFLMSLLYAKKFASFLSSLFLPLDILMFENDLSKIKTLYAPKMRRALINVRLQFNRWALCTNLVQKLRIEICKTQVIVHYDILINGVNEKFDRRIQMSKGNNLTGESCSFLNLSVFWITQDWTYL